MPLVLWNKTLKSFTEDELNARVAAIISAGEKVLSIAVPPEAPAYSESIQNIPVTRQTGLLIPEAFVYVGGEETWSKTAAQKAIFEKIAKSLPDAFGGGVVPQEKKKRGRPSLRPVIESMKKQLTQFEEERKKKRGSASREGVTFTSSISEPSENSASAAERAPDTEEPEKSIEIITESAPTKKKRGRPGKNSLAMGA